MSMFNDPGLFGRQWAAQYDATSNPDPARAVDFLAGMAGHGPVLELAIGTGRVALPLAARGIAVEGVEGSPEMVEKLRAKPGGADLPVVIGDMADVGVRGPYTLAYLVFNTLFNLVDAQRQADCFRNVARVLAPGGAFVIEAFVPNLADFERDEAQPQVRHVTEDSASFRMHRYDRAAQTFVRQNVTFSAAGVRLEPFGMSYLWPEQIDRLAEQAGLHLEARYAGWERAPFDAASTDHVSVYRL
ncbi:class I SAM-dependent methyltransferase [Actinoplanes friuliensis]|uniref:Methyltransferase n=1 Tax=Actinoplanes friuliensis DSM 7358 TaxID=1246995 RepID=U5VXE4_9ACTN|nr:class I SAM-dependent methyltransferase [Actinoplanes friuliensis]AGZ40331.1 methyltransferase [Actinoplanes friuliensis DSM 7358]